MKGVSMRKNKQYDIQRVAYRKLLMIDSAIDIDDLRIPSANRLEKLSGDREGQYSIRVLAKLGTDGFSLVLFGTKVSDSKEFCKMSIRVNRQFRICFTWEDGFALDVEIVDYH